MHFKAKSQDFCNQQLLALQCSHVKVRPLPQCISFVHTNLEVQSSWEMCQNGHTWSEGTHWAQNPDFASLAFVRQTPGEQLIQILQFYELPVKVDDRVTDRQRRFLTPLGARLQ